MIGARQAGVLGLCLSLVMVGLVPVGAQASHEIPAKLDTVHLEGEGGYAAWRVQAEAPSEGGWPRLYQHLGEHMFPTVRNASYSYLGVWFVNLDYDYVWWAVVATVEHDGTDVNIRTTHPVSLDRNTTVRDSEWSTRNGGNLPIPPGEWLVLAFWQTDGTIDAEMTLGSETENGSPLIELTNRTAGGPETVFSHENRDFGGTTNVHAAADAENTCRAGYYCAVESFDARYIKDGSVTERFENAFFGAFVIPGWRVDAGWQGPPGSARGDDRSYFFHGARSGEYSFNVHENVDAAWPREPVAVTGADVEIPGPAR